MLPEPAHPEGHGGHAHHPALAHHFDNLAQQGEASTLGMWVFLVTEVLFFGGLFLVYLVYRSTYPEAFIAGSHELDVLLGGINTAVLITSSLTMALAVHAAQTGHRRTLMIFLVVTMVLGAAFLGIKSVEYYHKFVEHHVPGPGFQFEEEYIRHAQLFFSLYFIMTGLHALHMIIGLGIMTGCSGGRGAASSPPSTTARSRSAASTGTSSTSSGFSCSRCCICWGDTDDATADRTQRPQRSQRKEIYGISLRALRALRSSAVGCGAGGGAKH